MLKNLKLSVKIGAGFAAFTGLCIVIGFSGYVAIGNIIQQVEVARSANNIIHKSLEIRRQEKNILIRKDEEFFKDWQDKLDSFKTLIQNSSEVVSDTDTRSRLKVALKELAQYEKAGNQAYKLICAGNELDNQMRDAGRDIEVHLKKIKGSDAAMIALLNARRQEKNIIIYRQKVLHQGERTYLQKYQSEMAKINDLFSSDKDLIRLTVQYQGLITQRANGLEQLDVFVDDMEKTARAVVANADNILKKARNTLDSAQFSGRAFILIILGVCILASVLMAFFITRAITRWIDNGIELANAVADGDLTKTIDVDRKDEIGHLFDAVRSMIGRLRDMASSINDTTSIINSSTSEISAGAQEQSAISSEQASSIAEIAATIEELSASFAQIAQHAENVTEIASRSSANTKQGAGLIAKVEEKIEEINSDNENNIKEIVDLGKKTRDISKVMEIINKIADQTKLIAFNAALEASSAGEAGKRFGVVASEIRKLAENTMESTKDIEASINEIQEAVNHMVIASEKTTKGIKQGMEFSSNAMGKIDEIVAGSQATADAAKQISMSTQNQKTATDQIAVAIKEINEGANQTVAAVKQLASIGKDLSVSSNELSDRIKGFKLGN